MEGPAALRIGILGGTYNPIHNAHILLAETALQSLALDRVLLMVDRDPPHKTVQGGTPGPVRYQMVQAAADALQENLIPCDMELYRQGKSYTVDTLAALHEQYPGAQLFWIVGGDMLDNLPHWKNVAEIFRSADIICAARKDRQWQEEQLAEQYRQQYQARIHLLSVDLPPISSTEVRERVQQALPVSHLIPNGVETYIYEQGVYLPEEIRCIQKTLRETLKESRYRHTMGVVRTAIDLACRYGEDPQKARLAALLHDCGRGVEPGALKHAQVSAQMAKDIFGVHDESILRAIRLHTTGAAGMSRLERIIYLADMIEPYRAYPGVDALRALAAEDLDRAVLLALEHTIAYVQAQGQRVHPASLEALKDLQLELS